MPSPRILRRTLVLCLAITLLPLLGLSEIELCERRINGRNTTSQREYVPAEGLLQAASLGYNELVADMLWIRTIAYFVDHLFSDRDYRHLSSYLSRIVALDGHFKAVYRYGSSMLMSRGAHQTNEDVFAAIRLLERGHRTFPDEWAFPLHLGAYYMTELRTKDARKRARWRRQGADWIRTAAMIGPRLPWLPSLAAKVYTEQGQRELAIRHLQELYLVAKDDRVRKQIEGKLSHLKAAQVADNLRRVAREFAAAHRRSGLSFLFPDLFALLQLPPLEPFSVDGP